MSSVLSSPSPWPQLPRDFLGGVDAAYPDEDPTNDLLLGMAELDRGRAYLAYAEYQSVAALYDRLVAAREDTDGFVVDGFADAAARIAKLRGTSRGAAETLLNDAVALRDRLPEVSECLRDGIINPWHAQKAVSRTDLLAESSAAPAVDADIAETLRTKRGTWSKARFRDMIDRIVFRHDPDAVRERRQQALDDRRMWTHPREDGTAEITGVMSAENVRIAAAAVAALADSVCEHDPRTKPQRQSDAMFCLLSGTAFECDCGRDDCTAVIPEPGVIPPVDCKAVLHVVADEATVKGMANNAGFMEGHGVISGEHVRDIAARADTTVSYLVPPTIEPEPDGTFTLPAHLPSDPYRPSAALDTFIRLRDGYCTEPGCLTSAWRGDLDHVDEYDHACPHRGGQTTEVGLNAKCRPGHLLKTFGDWVDDQWRDDDGRLVTEYITPEGLVLPGEAETQEDLFPGLRRIRFTAPAQAPPPHTSATIERSTRVNTRVANKHARRRAERARNRKRVTDAGPPPF
ncbi:DUF222 domain-containing protein [Gordonia sp. Z-3]|uniref:DUF222 domain-containing protein n=1 Tax=Gordonia sp. Z-3 TaxID=3115408 RepID=UPI002E2DB8DC|nr:DUF222 domain-containing protein [Gordonia sp. Z-3]MED5803461.1 DUF222 domain-containing protein [Gordonia sp. Z-3]